MRSASYDQEKSFMKFSVRSQNGFAMVAALMSIMVLTAVGLLVFAVSTQDVRISSRVVGRKSLFRSRSGDSPLRAEF
jgi:Tfp pilus assembly protein PilX